MQSLATHYTRRLDLLLCRAQLIRVDAEMVRSAGHTSSSRLSIAGSYEPLRSSLSLVLNRSSIDGLGKGRTRSVLWLWDGSAVKGDERKATDCAAGDAKMEPRRLGEFPARFPEVGCFPDEKRARNPSAPRPWRLRVGESAAFDSAMAAADDQPFLPSSSSSSGMNWANVRKPLIGVGANS